VWARGNNRQNLFFDDGDFAVYLAELGRVVLRNKWRLLAYCLMDNHVHLIVETPEPNLANGMQLLHGRFARFVNDRWGRSGHLFQGRYGSRLINDDAHLLTAAAYVAMNPVDAGLCADPEDWRWSSHAATVAGKSVGWLDVARLVEIVSTWGRRTIRHYKDAITSRLADLRRSRTRGQGSSKTFPTAPP
jgi:REP element-mobilizing transposase RayT